LERTQLLGSLEHVAVAVCKAAAARGEREHELARAWLDRAAEEWRERIGPRDAEAFRLLRAMVADRPEESPPH
jgi:hypothetical protein